MEPLYGLHHRVFGNSVKGAGGFIKYQDSGLFIKCTGNADALSLPAAETDAASPTTVSYPPDWHSIKSAQA